MPLIDEALRSRLERQYHPTVFVSNSGSQNDTIAPSEPTESLVVPFSAGVGLELTLPTEMVSEVNLPQQYASFIKFCNPTIPIDTDTTELCNIFQSPPKSDGKSFQTWDLFQLIKKLESKEIKTWAQLALDLGVESPSLEKGQSAQKVQQYAVRLKRWMHAMHVDAFFEFLLKKSHPYYTKVPPADGPQPQSRDGVPTEEDLALRALLPETRPKRGRRKNEDRDDVSMSRSPAQRPRLASPTLSEDFELARSAIVPGVTSSILHSFDDRSIPWSAVDGSGQSSAFHWPPAENDLLTPHTAYPQSAITPTIAHTWGVSQSQSAITPNSRTRRKHGPAVSSAWSSSSAGKLRGRPPSNRNVQDGPFSTFPANPPATKPNQSVKETVSHIFTHDITRDENTSIPAQSAKSNRLSLSLQVPQRQGGEVRLATPPPVVIVNDHDDLSGAIVREQFPQHDGSVKGAKTMGASETHKIPAHTSTLTPEVHPPRLSRMEMLRSPHDPDTTNVQLVENHIVAEILTARWISSTNNDGSAETTVEVEKCSLEEARQIAKHFIIMIKKQAFSEEMFLLNLTSVIGGGLLSGRITMERVSTGDQESHTTTYKLTRDVRFGSFRKTFVVEIGVPQQKETRVDEDADGEKDDWKQKYIELKQAIIEQTARDRHVQRELLKAILHVDERNEP